ncbi:hypothetical protein OV079_45265 [Nannocystis pusilla]|uniref:Uncharacterized protein n=1 Tax=Nannocystis pusilla TaxID=889268 RepID=A0A9X3J1C8_9BACT|nr:hypothetical protein [Nannocystis pusilla]MCY1012627.1 hypothetical protein [Nannocystis pusilla]
MIGLRRGERRFGGRRKRVGRLGRDREGVVGLVVVGDDGGKFAAPGRRRGRGRVVVVRLEDSQRGERLGRGRVRGAASEEGERRGVRDALAGVAGIEDGEGRERIGGVEQARRRCAAGVAGIEDGEGGERIGGVEALRGRWSAKVRSAGGDAGCVRLEVGERGERIGGVELGEVA